MPEIHSTAVIKPSAQIEDSVSNGPYCVVGDNVSLGAHVDLKSHVVVDGYTTIGEGTVVHPFVSLGLPPQHAEFRGEPSTLVIGANNSIREHVTMLPGSE